MSQWNPHGNGYPPPPQQGYPPNQPPPGHYPGYPPQNYPQYHAAPPQKSVASGVFWGLFLFFIVLPIGGCIACTTCAAVGTAGAGKTAPRR